MSKNTRNIALDIAAAIVMIGLVPIVANDIALTVAYIVIITALFTVKCEKTDLVIFFFGLLVMTCIEYLFITTGVEIFLRNSLFGVMPIWLPVLWGYGFVVIYRTAALIAES